MEGIFTGKPGVDDHRGLALQGFFIGGEEVVLIAGVGDEAEGVGLLTGVVPVAGGVLIGVAEDDGAVACGLLDGLGPGGPAVEFIAGHPAVGDEVEEHVETEEAD